MLKSLLLAVLLLAVQPLLLAETVSIDTSKGKQEVVVPEDYDSLRKAYLDMAKLYLEERFDHEASLEHVKTLTKDNADLIVDLRWAADKLLYWVDKKTRPDIFQVNVLGSWQTEILGAPTIGIGVQGILFERLTIGVLYNLPVTVQVIVGGRVF